MHLSERRYQGKTYSILSSQNSRYYISRTTWKHLRNSAFEAEGWHKFPSLGASHLAVSASFKRWRNSWHLSAKFTRKKEKPFPKQPPLLVSNCDFKLRAREALIWIKSCVLSHFYLHPELQFHYPSMTILAFLLKLVSSLSVVIIRYIVYLKLELRNYTPGGSYHKLFVKCFLSYFTLS